jgi:hypothetical protein
MHMAHEFLYSILQHAERQIKDDVSPPPVQPARGGNVEASVSLR